MESMLRKFGIRRVEPRETEARLKLQKDLFHYQKCVDYGFPNKACSISHNSELNLLSLGTRDGCLKIYGAPGVQFTAEHRDDVAVQKIFFFGAEGTIITYCADNTLHLWEVQNEKQFQEVRYLCLDDRCQQVLSFCLSNDHRYLHMGSDSGHVITLQVQGFRILERILFQENVIQSHSTSPEFRHSPGAVVSIQEHPTDVNKILIGYGRGLIALYDLEGNRTLQLYNSEQQLEGLSFRSDGTQFVSCHTNGSYVQWNTTDPYNLRDTSATPYGPFPCKAISKILWKSTMDKKSTDSKEEMMMVFIGGMPRASYGDRHAVTVMCDKRHVTFDLTSKVVDFLVLEEKKGENPGRLHTLLILAEEELVAIDLATHGWPTLPLPYMATLHASAITCCTHVGNVSSTFYEELRATGSKQGKTKMSLRPWPIMGGENYESISQSVDHHDLLVTGHEDGVVRIWDVSTTNIRLLVRFNTCDIFDSSSSSPLKDESSPRDDGDDDEEGADDNDEEDWPPFRRVGSFDPYSDDPRLVVRKIDVCKEGKVIAVGGAAGQLIVSKFNGVATTFDQFDVDLRPVRLNVIDAHNFTWKGHEALTLRKGRLKVEAGFQPVCVAQVHPPAACTAISINSDWQLAAVGTSHGFGVVDYRMRKFVEVKCTLNPADLSGAGEVGMSRRKSFKKSLRESFRRLRSRRSERHKRTTVSVGLPQQQAEDPARSRLVSSPRSLANPGQSPSKQHNVMATTIIDLDVPKPVERAVEARSTNDIEGSIVRAFCFADTFLLTGHSHSPTFWAGTNQGTVYIYQLSVAPSERRHEEEVQSVLAKEVHLRHRAPVMSICVVDRNGCPLSGQSEVSPARSSDASGGHSVLICSEEQIKVFSLPNLSAKEKFKLTAQEGSKIRKTAVASFASKSNPEHNETCLVCLTNLGEVNIFSIPSLKRQLKADCIKRDDIMGIVSCVFTPYGEAFYLDSPSEFSRFSVSAKVAVRPDCRVSSSSEATTSGRRNDDGARKETETSEMFVIDSYRVERTTLTQDGIENFFANSEGTELHPHS